jgi:hypothetical protein
MIIGGTIILASAIIPISIDLESHYFPEEKEMDLIDLKEEDFDLPEGYYATRMKRSCISIIWTCTIGIAIVFSALFSKAYRINKVRATIVPKTN